MKQFVVVLVVAGLGLALGWTFWTNVTGGPPAPHEGSRVTKAWADHEISASFQCRDGSSLIWTDQGYWSTRDRIFHEAPDFAPIDTEEPLRSCVTGH